MEAAVTRLARSPRLGLIYEDMKRFLHRERLARQKFYDTIDDGTKVEFINGRVIMHSPDRLRHIEVRQRIGNLLENYVRLHDLGTVGEEKLLVCLTRNDYMPDINFFGTAKASLLHGDQLKFPAPDLAVEILSPSTKRRDRGVKFEDYAAHGVAEYWIVDAEARVIEQYFLDDAGRYLLAAKVSGTKELRSKVVIGFRMPAEAAFDGAANLRVLRSKLK